MSLTENHGIWLEDRKLSAEDAVEAGTISNGPNLGFQYFLDGEWKFTKWRGPPKKFWIEWPLELPKEERRLIPWGLDALKDIQSDALIITEGELDALAWITAGAMAVISVPNGGVGKGDDQDPQELPETVVISPKTDRQFAYLWTPEGHLRPEINRFKKFILSTDGDKTGKILAGNLAVRLGRDRCWYLTYPEGCKDANDVLKKHGIGGLGILRDGAKPVVPHKLVQFADIPINERESYGVGWAGVEQHMKLRAPELMIVTGNAGSGKSQFVLNIGANLARIHGLKGAILQFEDHPERNHEDLLAYAAAWKSEIPDPSVWVNDMFRTIAPSEVTGKDENYTLEWLSNTIREAARVHDCKWVVIDPWNEVEHFWGGSENESAYTNRALAELKSLSRMLQIILIIVTHPSKSGAAKGDIKDLTLYDVSGSSAWKNKADHGVIVQRQETPFEVLIKIDKVKDQQRMGFPGTVRMRYNKKNASYEYLGKG